MDGAPSNIIGRTRQRRSIHAIFVTYDVDKVPDRPREFALNQIKIKFIDRERFSLVEAKYQAALWNRNRNRRNRNFLTSGTGTVTC
jgi:hypothetical protein